LALSLLRKKEERNCFRLRKQLTGNQKLSMKQLLTRTGISISSSKFSRAFEPWLTGLSRNDNFFATANLILQKQIENFINSNTLTQIMFVFLMLL